MFLCQKYLFNKSQLNSILKDLEFRIFVQMSCVSVIDNIKKIIQMVVKIQRH